MIVPAAIFIAINLAAGRPENLDGWAVPIATDIAFALAVLAVLSTHLPTALRTFLLTLAVVDDLLAITVIAVFYTDHLSLGPLALARSRSGCSGWPCSAACTIGGAGAAGGGRVGAGARQRGARHRGGRGAGLHRSCSGSIWPPDRGAVRAQDAAGVRGVRGAGVRVLRRRRDGRRLVRSRRVDAPPVDRRGDRRLGPWQAPRRVATAFLLARFTHASLDDDLAWRDVLGVSLLAGIGFTVSLLIGELAFGHGTPRATTSRSACSSGLLSQVYWPHGVVEPQRGLSAHSRTGDGRRRP